MQRSGLTMTRRGTAAALVGAAVVVAAATGIARRAEAYPIPPVTLWELTEKADTIVLATVEAERRRDGGADDDDDWNTTTAVLSVIEAWKGKPGARIDVPYPAGLLCPAPPRYEAGLTVLAFLERGTKGRYETVGLSYGTLYPEPPEVDLFRQLVRRASTAQAAADAGARETARVEWLVRAAGPPATRWHGLYALAPQGDALHSFYDDRPRPRITLTLRQLEELSRAFVAAPVLDVSMPMMLKVLAGHADAAVDEVAVAAVDTMLELKDPPFWTADVVGLTMQRLGKAPVVGRRRGSKSHLGSDPLLGGLDFDATKLRSRWAAVRKTLSFAHRTLDLPSNSGVRRVGATTPP
jgi:hypothetical protein